MRGIVIDDEIVAWSVPSDRREDALLGGALLIVMHGYGSHERDLISLAPFLPRELVIASLRAPLVAPAPVVNGFSWYPIGDPGSSEPVEVDASVESVLDWLDRVQGSVPEPLRIGALGFSQGGAMSLQLMRHAPDRITTAVNLSGFVIPGAAPADDELRRALPRVFWGRADEDPIIPAEAVRRTGVWLGEHASATERVYPGIGHSISPPEVEDVARFLTENLLV